MSELPRTGESGGSSLSLGRVGPLKMLLIFSQVTIIGFGGVMPFAYRALVERQRLLTGAEFAEMFAFGQILPGPGMANFALIVGYRDSGAPGAFAALMGLITLPMFLMITVGYFYNQYADLEPVRNAITGMATVTGGLVVAVGLKMSKGMHRRYRSLFLVAIGFVGFGILRLPFLALIAALVPLAVGLAWRDAGSSGKKGKAG